MVLLVVVMGVQGWGRLDWWLLLLLLLVGGHGKAGAVLVLILILGWGLLIDGLGVEGLLLLGGLFGWGAGGGAGGRTVEEGVGLAWGRGPGGLLVLLVLRRLVEERVGGNAVVGALGVTRWDGWRGVLCVSAWWRPGRRCIWALLIGNWGSRVWGGPGARSSHSFAG